MPQTDPNTPLSDDYLRAHADDPEVSPYFSSDERRRLTRLKSTPAPEQKSVYSKVADTVSDVGVGALKGVGNTVYGLGKVVHDYTPVGRISDAIQPGAFDQRPPELEPSNTAQRVGFTGEQVGEFMIPAGEVGKLGSAAARVAETGGAALARLKGGARIGQVLASAGEAGKVAKAANVAQTAGLTMTQGGSPTSAGVAGAITAVMPGGGAAKKAADSLKGSAEKTMAQALGATKEVMKDEAGKLAPEMLKRGVGGSRAAMLEQAKEKVGEVGAQLGQEYATAGAAGHTIPAATIRGELEKAAAKIGTTTADGSAVAIEGTQRVAKRLAELDKFVESLGPDIPVDKAAKIKQTWDQIVSKAGLYGPKATATATDNADAWAIREGAGAFRDLLNTNPSVEALNKEFAFWKGLKNVLTATQKRTQAQSGGLISAGMGIAGASVGAMSGDTTSDRAQNAVLGGLAGQQFIKLMQSPAWRTQVVGPLKNKLAEALASGNAERISSAIGRIMASVPSLASQ